MLTHPLLIESHRSQVLTIYQYTIRSAVSNVNPFRGLWLSHPLCITPCGFTGYVWAKGAFVVCRLSRKSSTHVRPFVNDIRIQTCDIDVGGGGCEGCDDIDDAVEGMETDEECYLESWLVTKCHDAHVTVADRWNAERKGGRPRDSSRLHWILTRIPKPFLLNFHHLYIGISRNRTEKNAGKKTSLNRGRVFQFIAKFSSFRALEHRQLRK